ncbi:hypothetical protein P3X46_009920 [Hevea brasiliensis]|uniref:Amino acid transporter transmembrane domain-containing protein n=1 Tax=Hevea brasiliensis TaxID=3981 RepID=A0ABQ9MG96_HEVBR|nr:hypothetical protein P3X46_009920 [Hevea brasiliensis]
MVVHAEEDANYRAPQQEPLHLQKEELDAGALFVLKSEGSWIHCGYHLTTSIVAPPLLSLPYAFTFLGWAAGISCLVIGALVTFYSYNLLSLVLEHNAQLGHRQLRFRDMANQILGPRWGLYFVGPIQFIVCYGAVVGCTLLGGQCMKFVSISNEPKIRSLNLFIYLPLILQTIYLLSNPTGTMKLYEFVIIFGCLVLILAQVPSFQSLRHINLISLLLCLAYSACATGGSVHIGNSLKEPKGFSLNGDTQDRIFGMFNAIAIIATTYGNGIIPEIQDCVYVRVILVTFLSVAISGYWAFGNQAEGLILSNFISNGKPLVPKWFEFSARNVIPRVVSRSLSVIIATTIAAMLPFFGDINSLIGAFGFMPLDFILPVVFFNLTFKPSKRSYVFWLNTTIAAVFSVLGVIAAIAAVRQKSLDAKTYRFFANV